MFQRSVNTVLLLLFFSITPLFQVLSISLILTILLRFNGTVMGIDFVTIIRNYRRTVDRNKGMFATVSHFVDTECIEDFGVRDNKDSN